MPLPSGEYAIIGIFSSAQAEAMPFLNGSVVHRLSSTSTAMIFVIAAASRMVVALTSLKATPPILPSSTSFASSPSVSFKGAPGSRLAHSNILILPRGPSIVRQFSTLFLTCSALPFGDRSFSTAPLMLRTTLSASSGNFSNYSCRRVKELAAGKP